jgi:hypothetical protein
MNDKLAVNFVSVTKPKERTPILFRRSKLISYLDRQLANVHSFKSGSQTRGAQFWLDQTGAIFLSINYGKYLLEVQKGKTTVRLARSERADRRAVWRKAASARAPEPTSAAPAAPRQHGWFAHHRSRPGRSRMLRSPTTDNSSRSMSCARSASAARMSPVAWRKVAVFDPNPTMPPRTALDSADHDQRVEPDQPE